MLKPYVKSPDAIPPTKSLNLDKNAAFSRSKPVFEPNEQPQTLRNVEHRTPPQLNYVVDSPKRLQPSGLALPSSRNQRFAEPACVTFSNQMCDSTPPISRNGCIGLESSELPSIKPEAAELVGKGTSTAECLGLKPKLSH